MEEQKSRNQESSSNYKIDQSKGNSRRTNEIVEEVSKDGK